MIYQKWNIEYYKAPYQHNYNKNGHASVRTTLDIYGHLLRELNTEQAKKLDSILGFEGYSGSSSDFGRKLVEKEIKKGSEKTPKPLNCLVAGLGFEPRTFGL